MIIIADNIHITCQAISKAVETNNPEPIAEYVKKCVDSGAEAIDVNCGPLTRNAREKICFLIATIQDITNLPLLIDSPNPAVVEAGLKACKNRAIINGFSLEKKKLDTILPLAKSHNVDVIGFCIREDSTVPANAQERLIIAVQLFEQCKKIGLPEERLIIDPVIVPLMWKDGSFQAEQVLQTIHKLPEVLGFSMRTIVGLSNLTTGRAPVKKKALVETVFLGMLAAAGLDMVLMNVFRKASASAVKVCNLLKKHAIFSWEAVQPPLNDEGHGQ